MDNKNNNKMKYIVLLLIIILILLYLLIQNFGYIDNRGPLVPTGNVDIFEIDCSCCNDDKTVFKEDDKNNNDINKNELEGSNNSNESEENNSDLKDIIVFDDYKIWDDKQLRIFSNPAYEYESIIAPGSANSYAFVIRNNNDFNVIVDILFEETNDKNINMNYKLKSNGNYLIGSEDAYETIKNKKIGQVTLPAKSQKAYILDWKWIDSDNDTQIGFDVDSIYKLSIQIGAN